MTVATDRRARESHIFAREENDHYAEPSWVSERLFDWLNLPTGSAIHDPACGFGRIVRSAASRGFAAYGSDLVARWTIQPDGSFPYPRPTFWVSDFLGNDGIRVTGNVSVVSNPPFKNAQSFAERAIDLTEDVVALLLPTKWIQGDRRSRWLEGTPFECLLPISPRPSMPPGDVWLSGGTVGGGTVDFSWFVWRKGYVGQPRIEWLRKVAA